MPETTARIVVTVLGVYAGAGAQFALAFVVAGAARVDARAAGAGWGFRALIFPGTILFWPLLARRWSRAHGSAG
jgi:hypothetical protein